jgi:hypothetical protein
MGTGSTFKAFLSHSTKDKPRVRLVKRALERAGVTCWFDEDQVELGDNIPLTVQKGLEASECVLLFWSGQSQQSDWVQEEWAGIFLKKRLIPVRLDDCEMPPFIGSRRAVDVRTHDRASLAALAAQLRR